MSNDNHARGAMNVSHSLLDILILKESEIAELRDMLQERQNDVLTLDAQAKGAEAAAANYREAWEKEKEFVNSGEVFKTITPRQLGEMLNEHAYVWRDLGRPGIASMMVTLYKEIETALGESDHA